MLNRSTSRQIPAPPTVYRGYIPALAAAARRITWAFTMQPANPPGCAPGPLQLASYTADANGNLNTNQYIREHASHLSCKSL